MSPARSPKAALCAAIFFVLIGPAHTEVYEAEGITQPHALSLKDDKASRKGYTTASYDGGSMAKFDVPKDQKFDVWVRYRGLPLILQTLDGRKIGSVEGKNNEWAWESFGTFTSDEVGSRLEVLMPFASKEVIEGRTLGTFPGVDMIAVTETGKGVSELEEKVEKTTDFSVPDADAVMKLPEEETPESAAPSQVEIMVDWAMPTITTTSRQFSLNVFGGFDPNVASDPRYAKNIEYMAPGSLRYHCMSLVRDPQKVEKSWLNEGMKTWNREKIGAALDGLPRNRFERVITIGKWPDWMDANNDGLLDAENYNAFAELCADLVRIINVEQKRGVQFFEITNERDITYWLAQMKSHDPLQVAELAKIYNLCAKAMKKVDPSIKTGGPASCRGDLLEPLKRFAIATLPDLDFFSYHAYASGSPSESDTRVFDKAQGLGKTLSRIRGMLDEVSPERKIEIHLNEFNICYTGKKRDPRMTNFKGAVFDALFFIAMAENGVAVGNAWNDINNVYGKMSPAYELNPAAHVFHYFNTLLVGQSFKAVSSNPREITPFAIESEDKKAIVFVNRSSHANTAVLRKNILPQGDVVVDMAVVDGSGLQTSSQVSEAFKDKLQMSPFSVTFLSWKK